MAGISRSHAAATGRSRRAWRPSCCRSPRCSSPQAPGLGCSPTRSGCPAQPPPATSSSLSMAASRARRPRPGLAAAEPSPRRMPLHGDSRESGWSISVGRQAARSPQEHDRTGATDMTIADKTVLVTGANRGIGQALVTEALSRGAKRVYAGTRQPLAHPDGRVTPLALDVTDAAQIQAAAESIESLDILINNAGLALYDNLGDRAALEQQLAVNLFGTYGVTQAFLPLLTPEVAGSALVDLVRADPATTAPGYLLTAA